MSLTKKQRKQIKDAAGSEDAATIAARLGLSSQEVGAFLRGLAKGGSRGQGADLTESRVGRVLGAALVILVGLAPLVFLSGLSDFANLPQSAFILAGTLVCFLLWLGPGFLGRGLVLSPSPLALPLLAFLSWAALSALLAHNTHEALTALSYWVPAGLAYAITHHAAAAPSLRRRLLLAMFLAGLAASLLGIAQYLFGFDGVPQAVPPAATFGNKNMAVHLLVLAWPLGLLFFLQARSHLTALAACGAGPMLIYLFYTGTRAGWFAFLIQALLLFALLWRERRRLGVVLIWNRKTGMAARAVCALFLFMINVSSLGFTNGAARIILRAKASSSVTWRLAVWRNTLEMIRDRPLLGFGLGNHKVFYPLYQDRAVKDLQFRETEQLDHVHNDILQAAAEMGLPGLALLLWLGVALGRTVRRGLASPDRDIWLLSTFLAVSTTGLLVVALFDFPFDRAVPPLLLLSQWGVLTAAIPGSAGKERRIAGKALPGALGGAAVLALALVLRHEARALDADRHFLAVRSFDQARQWEGVIQEGRRALLLDPARTQFLFYTGRALVEMGRNREGIADLERVIADYPYYLNALGNLCTAHENLGEHDLALQACGRVLAIKRDDVKVHIAIGRIHRNRGELGKALSSFRTAAGLAPNDAVVQFNLGSVAAKQKLYEEAARAFDRAIAAKPDWGQAHNDLGLINFYFLGRQEDGVRHLREALRLNPNISNADQIRTIIDRFQSTIPPPETSLRREN